MSFNVLDIFTSKGGLQKIQLTVPSSQQCIPQDMSCLDMELYKSVKKLECGTDYVAEYVEKEERELLKSAQYQVVNNNKLDDVSEGTCLALDEIHDSKSMQIYKTYNFAHRVKTKLTITAQKENIVSMIETNSVVIIQGPTGCGKTTQVPQFILDASYKKRSHCNIIVTQPRRIAAMSIAKRVSQERDWPLGTLVGYQVGLINHTGPDTRLTYCTTGVLLHKLINKKNMQDFTHIIIDEVHERDQDMDFLLLVVRKLWRLNSRNVKIILMSATFEVNKFAKYFSSPVANKLAPAPIIDIVKTNYFNKSIYYLCQIGTLGPLPEVSAQHPKVSKKMMEFCVRIVFVLDDLDMKADDANYDEETGYFDRHVILIFLPGIHEIEEMHNLLSLPRYESRKWDILVLHSMITNEEQHKIFIKPPNGYRRIILSTNIAESSVTLPDVKYVIDFCLTKQLVTDPNTNFQCLELVWASKSSCEQRAGRAGRLMDGRVYRLIPRNFYETVLPAEATPEMLQAPLENVVLKTKLLDLGEPKAILALSLDPPDLSNLERTILILKEVGALHNNLNDFKYLDGELTHLGRIMAHLPLDIRVAKLIMLGHVFSVLKDAIIIAAAMSVKDMFINPFQEKILAYNVKLSWADQTASDCIAFLNAYSVWITEKASRRLSSDQAERKWAHNNCLQIRALREIKALISELTTRLEQLGVIESVGVNKVVWGEIERPFILKFVIAGAFYPNYFVSQMQGESVDDDRTVAKLLGGMDPYSTVYLQGWPFGQPGLLYAQHFQKMFEEHAKHAGEDITVLFDSSSRVYIQFNKKGNITHEKALTKKISLSVYNAIKMRHCKVPLEVPILPQSTAIARAEEMKLITKVAFDRPGLLTQNTYPAKCTSLIRAQLPDLSTSLIPIIIRYRIDPGHFWINIRNPMTARLYERIKKRVNTSFESYPKLTSLPEIGSFVLAPLVQKIDSEKKINGRKDCDKNTKYERAIVQSYVKNSDVLAVVFYIDNGGTASVQFSEIRSIDPHDELARLPALGLECVLANIRPAVAQNLNECWSRTAFDIFTKVISKPGQLFGEIYSVVNSVIALDLIIRTGDDEVNVNQYLIENNFAIRKQENFLSRFNHNLRLTHLQMSKEQRQHYEELQYDQTLETVYPDPPELSECHTTAKLRGPFSPLEAELVHMTVAGRDKKVTTALNSVNSVLLDSEPEDSCERLLVAATVGQNASATTLTLHNTTQMPNIRGIAALVVLTFTPHMELRRNDIGTRYIGALCGLGYDPETEASIFPEHDIELKFDVEISLDDLQYINRLRHWMNTGIQIQCSPDSHERMDDLIICQNKVKNAFLNLMQKARNSQNTEVVANFHRWHLYDDSLLLHPGLVPTVTNNIFKLHYALVLEEKTTMTELKEHLLELKDLANVDEKDWPGTIQCKFCNVELSNVIELRTHLYTLKHRQNEENI